MQVFLDIQKGWCKIVKDPIDKPIKDESQLLYHVKNHLTRQGHVLIKKRMWKDGHMVDDKQQYVRSKNLRKDPFCVYNSTWQIADAHWEYNERGVVTLAVVKLS